MAGDRDVEIGKGRLPALRRRSDGCISIRKVQGVRRRELNEGQPCLRADVSKPLHGIRLALQKHLAFRARRARRIGPIVRGPMGCVETHSAGGGVVTAETNTSQCCKRSHRISERHEMTSPMNRCAAFERRWFRTTDDGVDYRKERGSRNTGRDCVHHTIRRDRSIIVAISFAQTGSEWPRRTEVWPHLARLAALACSRLLSLQKRLVLR